MRSFSQIRGRALEGLRRLGEAATGLLYPPHCAGCGGETEAGRHVCPMCASRVRRIRQPRCQVCSEPFPGAMRAEFTCAECLERKFPYRCAVAPLRATGLVRELIHRFKYNGQFYLRHPLIDWISEGLRDPRLQSPRPSLIVPVPLHAARLREREFNQAEVLARGLAGHSGVPLYEALRRTRYTTTQTALDREERMENLRGAFALRQPDSVTGHHLLLIDDVYTTGSTVEECARVLIEAGAATVRVLTVARAISKH